MSWNSDEQDALNEKHLACPQVGDYWQEMFCPVLVVLHVAPDGVITVCRKTKDVDRDHWTWDLRQREMMTKGDFRKHLSYSSDAMKHKPYCDVMPQAHAWAAEVVKEGMNHG